ncbi:UNVERIFIED_CONTAM: type II toxin-antitoxin system prevent-host-death family antitoxin [Kocuria sp. CPCC 205295]|uniref:type II toxin-antitoxin system Phd/YefM family antitoxin n=1 Tax=Kocuria TaxID=57493 RepID=UPI0034D6A649
MKTMTYSESRQRYAEVLDSVVITRSGRESAVILSLEDYESLRETAYLMRSPANARRLLDAIPEGPQAHQLASRGHPAQQQ